MSQSERPDFATASYEHVFKYYVEQSEQGTEAGQLAVHGILGARDQLMRDAETGIAMGKEAEEAAQSLRDDLAAARVENERLSQTVGEGQDKIRKLEEKNASLRERNGILEEENRTVHAINDELMERERANFNNIGVVSYIGGVARLMGEQPDAQHEWVVERKGPLLIVGIFPRSQAAAIAAEIKRGSRRR